MIVAPGRLLGLPADLAQSNSSMRIPGTYVLPHLEYCDIDSTRSADSLEFEEPIRLYPCTVSGCKVTCKRPYELERHRQTVHNQSRHWFCPVDSCLLSCAIAGLAKIHLLPELKLIDYIISRQRRPLTCKLRVSEDDGYANLELNGFKRKDKLTKHLKEAHKVNAYLHYSIEASRS